MKVKVGNAKAAAKATGKLRAKVPAKVASRVTSKPAQGSPAVKAAPKKATKKPEASKTLQHAKAKSAKVSPVSKGPAKQPLILKGKAAKLASKTTVAKAPSKTPAPAVPKAAGKINNLKSAVKAAAKNVTQEVTEVVTRKTEPKGVNAAGAKVAAPVKVVAASLNVAQPPGAAVLTPNAGRPSSRLAQLSVVGMAQSVASTAAKSSYLQSVALPVIVPSLAMAPKKDPKLANNWKTKPVEQLSDPELIAMPDAEYMNEKQMAVFRLKLSVLKQDILNSAGETTEHLREDTVVVPDPADRATIEEEHALELRTRDRERKLLKKIEQSINRIDAGDYGFCDETGEPIGVGRLIARPTATLSLEAQQRRELKQKMFGD